MSNRQYWPRLFQTRVIADPRLLQTGVLTGPKYSENKNKIKQMGFDYLNSQVLKDTLEANNNDIELVLDYLLSNNVQNSMKKNSVKEALREMGYQDSQFSSLAIKDMIKHNSDKNIVLNQLLDHVEGEKSFTRRRKKSLKPNDRKRRTGKKRKRRIRRYNFK